MRGPRRWANATSSCSRPKRSPGSTRTRSPPDHTNSPPRHGRLATWLTRDESIRSDSTPEALVALKPAFRLTGTITASDASPLSDGVGALCGSTVTARMSKATPVSSPSNRRPRPSSRGSLASVTWASDAALQPGPRRRALGEMVRRQVDSNQLVKQSPAAC